MQFSGIIFVYRADAIRIRGSVISLKDFFAINNDNSMYFFLTKYGPFPDSFSLFSSLLLTIKINICSIKVADDCIRTRVLWNDHFIDGILI